MFVPIVRFGAEPDIAGKNIANPYALIMSGQMLLEWLGRNRDEPKAMQAAALITTAMDKVIAEKRSLTPDLGGQASTSDGDAMVGAICKMPAPASL